MSWNSNRTECGLMVRCCIKGKPVVKNVPVKSITISSDIFNNVANLTSTLLYVNDTDEPMESIFAFPLDEGVALYHFEAHLDDRVISAQIMARDEARSTYERAVENKQTAFLLEQDVRSDDLFKISLGNLPAKGEARLILKYAQELDIVALDEKEKLSGISAWSLALPTVLNPRYDPVVAAESFSDNIPLTANKYEFSFTANVRGSMAIDRVEGRKDNFTLEFIDDFHTKAKATLKTDDPNKDHRDHDLELNIYYKDAHKAHVVYERGDVAGVGDNDLLSQIDVAMLNFIPKINASQNQSDANATNSEFIFVVDQSGSMDGDRIERAKETLLLLLKSLPVGCNFQIVGFGSTFINLFPTPQEYNEENLKKGLECQANLNADLGGTEILEPLKDLYSKSIKPGYARFVFIMTDGEVSNVDEVLKLVKSNAHNTTVFAVGIGEGASTALVKGIAKASGGRAEFVKDEEKKFSAKILDLLQSAMSLRINNATLNVQLPPGVTFTKIPEVIPPLFDGRFFTQFLFLQGDLHKLKGTSLTVTLTGDLGGSSWSFPFVLQRPDNSSSADLNRSIHRLAAKRQIQQIREDVENVKSISKAFNIMSPHTSFVGVDTKTKDVLPEAEIQTDHRNRQPMMCFMSAPPMCAMRSMPAVQKCSVQVDSAFCLADDDEELESEDFCLIQTDSAGMDFSNVQTAAVAELSATLKFASSQQFNGSWKASDETVWNALGLNAENTLKNKPTNWSDDEFVSVLVIAFLKVRCFEDADEWILLVGKAKRWLSSTKQQAEIDRVSSTSEALFVSSG